MQEILDVAVSFLTLTLLEIILGIDNLVFLAIVSERLPRHQQKIARQIGLSLAWILRLLLLAFAIWLVGLTQPFITLWGHGLSWRDVFLLVGGLFLLFKATQEIHIELEPKKHEAHTKKKHKAFALVVTQIVILDLVFSLDSILTAVGLTNRFWLMATAVTIAIIVMLFLSESITRFIHKNPTIKMLALSFLMLIGMMLLADGMGFHIPRGYIYFAMSFSLLVELLNIWRHNKRKKTKMTILQ